MNRQNQSFIPHDRGASMHSLARVTLSLVGLSVAGSTTAFQQERDRSKIPDEHKWDLTPIYATDEVWRKEKERLQQQLQSVERFRGSLGSSSKRLLECLETVTGLAKEYARLSSYASMSSDTDTRDSKYLGMQQEMSQIGSDFAARVAFLEPEILTLDRSRIEEFLSEEPGLVVYRHYLHDIQRRKEHTGTEAEEKIIADAGLMADGAQNIYSVFSDADFPFPEVTLSDGAAIKLDKARFSLARASQNRDDRKKAFAEFFGKLNEYRRTFGAQLNAEVKKNLFYMKARKYTSCLESALDANNIPTAVYHRLINGVNANLATFHRYLRLRQRILGLDELHYYDLYAPLIGSVDLRYDVAEAERHILKALEPLGNEYTAIVGQSFRERWIDMYPTEGKRSGAYSNGSVYDVHPYILMNYNGKYDDVSTLAHELGHTMHSYLSNKSQPYATANYPIFVAEVASTFNEALLIDYMLKTIDDDGTRLSLLGNYLEGIKGTVFRQTQFAEFELRIHEMAERGEPITGDALNALYEGITRKYYGHDLGVCLVDDEIKAEWAYIPHFYYNFYVFQYATSFTASTALSEQVLAGNTDVRDRFIEFLSSGGSDYPINLLKKAGVDMTTAGPFDLTMKKMNRVMDEMEAILARMKQ
jgi:oligoendopeptidase F